MEENKFTTIPAPIVAEGKYKTISCRLIAYVIDYLLFVPLMILPVAPRTNDLLVLWLLAELQRWAPLIYRVVLHGVKGQTVGKMWTRVRVYDLSERPISMKQAILRDIVMIAMSLAGAIVTLIVVAPELMFQADSASAPGWVSTWLRIAGYISYAWLAAEIAVMLLNTKRRAIHDFIARSVVLKMDVQAEDPATPRVLAVTGAVMAAIGALLLPTLAVIDGEICPGYKADLSGYYPKLIPLTLVAAVLGAVLGGLIERRKIGGGKGWAIAAVALGLAGCVLLNMFIAIFPGC